MPELEAWEKVIITGTFGDEFLASAHGPDFEGDNGSPHVLTCQHCHGGADDFTFATMDEAHTDMIADPSALGDNGCRKCHADDFARSACDQCHADAVTKTSNSLHSTQGGYITAIEARCGCDFEAQGEMVADGFEARCAGCHTTCGQCHISRPESVGGGFPKIGRYYSHRFAGTPDMSEQCTACHGSRIGHDYNGDAEGNERDVHRDAGMRCEACHSMEEIHGDGNEYMSRYEMPLMPRCEDCHDGLSSNYGHVHHTGQDPDCGSCHHFETDACQNCHDGGTAFAIADPLPNMQCQTCHAQPYKNCTNCHNLVEGPEGYDIDPSVLQLKIARVSRPVAGDYPAYDVSLVRHIPVDPGTYANWGLTLDEFASEPTWRYTSPHNVIASAPQTQVPDGESCSYTCHGTAESPSPYLLRLSDLDEAGTGDQQANIDANDEIVIPDTFPSGR